MATIQEILDFQMGQVGEKIRRFMFPRLQQQVPRVGNTPNNKYATGALARSLTPNMIRFEKAADGQWELFIDLDQLPNKMRWRARATNFGSRQNSQFMAIRQAGIFGLPFVGYVENESNLKGIRAQNWTAMDGFESRVNKLVQDKLNASFETIARDTIKQYTTQTR